MKISIRAYSIFSDFIGKQRELEIHCDLTVKDLVEYLYNSYNIPREVRSVVIVNGKVVDENYLVKDGDIVVIAPPFSGG
ncbi:MAG: MoaD/ThiS family protein [Desulfurococcaceae archaeon]